jgi:hypothetical protein
MSDYAGTNSHRNLHRHERPQLGAFLRGGQSPPERRSLEAAFSHFPPRIGMAMRITPIAPATSDPIQTSDTRVRAAMAPRAMAI